MLTITSMPSTMAFSPAAPSPIIAGQPLLLRFSWVTERLSRPPSPASMAVPCCRAQLVIPDRQKHSPRASVLVYPWAAPRDGNSSIDVLESLLPRRLAHHSPVQMVPTLPVSHWATNMQVRLRKAVITCWSPWVMAPSRHSPWPRPRSHPWDGGVLFSERGRKASP